jgi:hypothetical protein
MPFRLQKHVVSALDAMGKNLLKRLETPVESYEKRIINNMQNLRKEIKKGDVLLVEGRSKISSIIQLLTNSSWSHAAFYVGDRLKYANAKHMKNSLNSLRDEDQDFVLIEAEAGSGVTAVPLNKYKDYNIRICRPFGISAKDLDSVVNEIINNIGKHYDNENLIDLALLLLPSFLNPFKKRTIQACLGGCSQYKVICSGMIAKAFQMVGYPIVPSLLPKSDIDNPQINDPYGTQLIMRHYSQIIPRDFDLSPNFEIVKYNIIGLGRFDYQSMWADGPKELVKKLTDP